MVENSQVRNRRIKFLDDEDRISELPDSIIQHILSLLPSTKEAIRTGILSKRWRNQWTHVPLLIFRPPYDFGDEHKYLKFIETTLILHDCPKIKKFHLEYDVDYNTDPQFSSKVHFAIRKCVEELILICENPLYSLPRVLFDSASLVRLEIVNCPLVANWKVNWPSLKSLKIIGYYHDNNRNKGIENILSGSPLLERLELYECDLDNVAIVSKSLKLLCFVNVEDSTGIRISCPNLVEFNVFANGVQSTLPEQLIESVLSGSPFIHSLEIRCCIGFNSLVIASKSLKVLSIQGTETTVIEVICPNLEKLDFGCWRGESFKAVNLPSSICATIDYYYYYPPDHNSVKEMLEQFQHVKKLTIGRSLCRNISKLVVEDRLSLPLLNCKRLTVNVDDNFGWAVPGIAYALCSPMLEALVINVEFLNYQDTWDKDLHGYWNSYGCSGLSCLVSQLKTVKIIGLCGKDRRCKLVFEFIEFVLKNARVLEKMIVEFRKPREGL